MNTRRKKEWFDNDTFWRELFSFMFPEKRFADAAAQIFIGRQDHRTEAIITLGQPTGRFEAEKILTFRLGFEPRNNGYYVVERETTINFQPKNMSLAELQTGFLGLVKQLYSAGETHTRRAKFKRMLKTSPYFGRRAKDEETQVAA